MIKKNEKIKQHVKKTYAELAKNNSETQNFKLFLKNLILFVFLVVSALIVVPLGMVWLANDLLTFSVGYFRFLGLIPIGVGVVFMLYMFIYFALAGRGTPAPFDPPKKLITQGLFRYVRNPGYIGGVLILVGEGIFLESAVVFIFTSFMWVIFHLYVVYYEEPGLKEMFGESYEEYFKTVPRWIPKRPKKENIR